MRITADNYRSELMTPKLCSIHCARCGNNNHRITRSAIKPEFSKFLRKYILRTKCPICRSKEAIVMRLEVEKAEAMPFLDKYKMTQSQLNEKRDVNYTNYAKKHGSESLKRDFLQPYKNSAVNKDFVEAYGVEKAKDIYSVQALDKAGLHKIADEKRKETDEGNT